ncbi:ABC transporter permease [Thermodesulfobacteriota bacterium]
MKLNDLLRISIRQVLRQRRRNLGVISAIALGTAGLIVIVTMGRDVKESFNKDLEILGGATRIRVSFENEGDSRPRKLHASTVDAIRRLSGVTGVSLLSSKAGYAVASYRDRQIPMKLVGVDEYFWSVNSFTPLTGRFFGAKEVAAGARVCVLGEELARTIFGHHNVAGLLVTIEGDFYRVVGVLGGLGISERTRWVFLPFSTARDRIAGMGLSVPVYIRCHSWDDVESVAAAIHQIVGKRRSVEGLRIEVAWEQLRRVRRMAWLLQFFVYLAVAATLILGGVGIWNIMMSGVQSRTREIGLKKSIGAEDGDILAQFLAEALCLSIGAGCIGVILGRGIVEALGRALGTSPPKDVFYLCVGLSFFFSVLLGICAGLWPAIRASRMEVVSAIRHE